MDIGMVVALIKKLAPAASPEAIQDAVDAWLTAHPEATTTVQDGSITEAKLAQELAAKINGMDSDVSSLKSAINSAVFWEQNPDDDTVEDIIKSEIKEKMEFSLTGNVLSILYDGDTVTSVTLPSQSVPCTGVELDVSATSVEWDKTVTLTATLTPENTTDAVTWNSSDSEVATVDDGVVTGVAKGTATITVTCGNFSDTCTVTVVAYFRDLVLGYVLSQSNRIDYESAYGYKKGCTFNDPFLKKVSAGQKVSLKYTPGFINNLYAYMYVYSAGSFTDKCSKVGNDYVLTQAMLDMESSNTYGILISSEKLHSYNQYASLWEGDYTAESDCYVAFWFNLSGVESDISSYLPSIKQAIRIEVE